MVNLRGKLSKIYQINQTQFRMKKIIVFLFSLAMTVSLLAQDQMFAVYRHQVKPSMDQAYREAVKKLKTACQQNKLNISWISGAYDDNSYNHLVPIKSFADMDKNMFGDLETKIGKETVANLFREMDKCLESQTSFIAMRVAGLSYLNAPEDELFRSVLYWYPEPGKEAEAEKIVGEWLNLHKSKNAPGGIITYKIVFGNEPGYAFVGWGKNRLDWATKSQKNDELFKDEASKLWAKTMLITKKYYTVAGWRANDLAYTFSAN